MKDEDMWIRVTRPFTGWLKPLVLQQDLTPSDAPQQVRRVLGEAAIEAGCAEEVAAPARSEKAKG